MHTHLPLIVTGHRHGQRPVLRVGRFVGAHQATRVGHRAHIHLGFVDLLKYGPSTSVFRIEILFCLQLRHLFFEIERVALKREEVRVCGPVLQAVGINGVILRDVQVLVGGLHVFERGLTAVGLRVGLDVRAYNKVPVAALREARLERVHVVALAAHPHLVAPLDDVKDGVEHLPMAVGQLAARRPHGLTHHDVFGQALKQFLLPLAYGARLEPFSDEHDLGLGVHGVRDARCHHAVLLV
mmetsp:Transcript_2525/g.6032  ORF Transcript_2525/g.6032 Transcript_2525/m.6032 type:complete len:240 (+) Transcript_2525:1208-1927(+)